MYTEAVRERNLLFCERADRILLLLFFLCVFFSFTRAFERKSMFISHEHFLANGKYLEHGKTLSDRRAGHFVSYIFLGSIILKDS